jgi:hypothetical protein
MTETTYLMNLIIGFLTPMLLDATGGDRAQAEKTAIQTVNAYAASTSPNCCWSASRSPSASPCSARLASR